MLKRVEIETDSEYKITIYEIEGLYFVLTCEACPEQYDVYKSLDDVKGGFLQPYDPGARQIGYVRLRHSHLRAECPFHGVEVFNMAMHDNEAYGDFHSDEIREKYLTEIAKAMNEHYEDLEGQDLGRVLYYAMKDQLARIDKSHDRYEGVNWDDLSHGERYAFDNMAGTIVGANIMQEGKVRKERKRFKTDKERKE